MGTRRTLWPRVSRLAITFLVAVTLLVPAAYWFAPAVHRWQMMRRVTAADPAVREQGLSYIIRRAGDEPAVLDGAVAILGNPDLPRGQFLALVSALTDAGVWARPGVPPGPWLRWLGMLAGRAGDPSAQRYAAIALRDLTGLADDGRVKAMLGELLQKGDPGTRAAALTSATRLAGRASKPGAYADLVAEVADDPRPHIARRAWLVLGLLGKPGKPGALRGLNAHWQNAPPKVAQAMLWALAHTRGPGDPAIAQAFAQPGTRPAAAMAYALSASPAAAPAASPAAAKPAAPPAYVLHAIAPDQPLTTWRLVLGIDPARLPLDPWRPRLRDLIHDRAWHSDQAPISGPLLAMLHRQAPRLIGTRSPAAVIHGWPPLAQLAVLESLPPGSLPAGAAGPGKHPPPLLKLTYLDKTRDPDPDAFYPLLCAKDPTLRDIACVTAARRLTGEQAAGLIGRLLHDFNDHARMSAGILAGLTGRRLEEVKRRARVQHTWAVKRVMELGPWMRGDDRAMPGGAGPLLRRRDVPTTTVLLAMLHRGQTAPALAYLFNTDGARPDDLVALLDRKRWWRVLGPSLPKAAPRFWVWADPGVMSMQIDLLRAWATLHSGPLTGSNAGG